ncbi:MAG: T9SS type A sorting domain-containing protein [Bacteroidota bacterium]
MKKILLSAFFLLTAVQLSMGQTLSQFTWDSSPNERIADIGPNGQSSGNQAEAQPTGNGSAQGLAPGCGFFFGGNCLSNQNINLVLPNPGGMFDVPEVQYQIDYRRTDGETECWFFTRDQQVTNGPLFRMGLEFGRFTVQFSTDNGFGGNNNHNIVLFNFWGGATPHIVPNDATWRTYAFSYDQASGIAVMWVNGAAARVYSTGTPGAPLVWPTTLVSIAPNLDNQGVDLAVLDNSEISVPLPLPVTYNYFHAEQVGQRSHLMWETANESNSSHFRVLRASGQGEFIEVGTVNAAGTSNEAISYEFYDPNPQPGSNFYRLDQIDLNGTSHLSSVVEVQFELNETGLIGVYPNPLGAEGNLNIKFRAEDERSLNLQIFDLQGRSLIDETHALDYEITNLEIPANRLPEGIYFVRVIAGGKSYTKKILRTE